MSVLLNTCPFLVEKSSAPQPYEPEGTLTYEIDIANVGESMTLDNVVLTDSIPSPVTVSSALASGGGVCTPGSVVECELGDLAPGESVNVAIHGVVSAGASGGFENVAEVVS